MKTQRRATYWAKAAILLTLVVIGFAAPSLAASCGPANPEASRLKRQIAANLAFQDKRGCASGASSFACRELATRIAAAGAGLASLSPACTAAPKPKAPSTVRRQRPVPPPVEAAKIETMCVRLSDGYYFPTPNSGFRTANDQETMKTQCQSVCADPAMDVFRLDPNGRETDDMVSLSTGGRYADLPRAGAYRTAPAPLTCDMHRSYGFRLIRPETVLRANVASAALPSPSSEARTTKAEPDTTVLAVVEPASVPDLFGSLSLRGTQTFLPPAPRKVRLVGAAFLPEE